MPQLNKETALTIPLRTLRKCLAAVLPAVDRSSPSAGVGVVRVQQEEGDSGRVEFAASDRSLTIRVSQRIEGAAIARPAYLPAARLESYARLLDGETVTLTAKGERKVISLSCGGTLTRFATESGDEFPHLAPMPETPVAHIGLETLRRMLRSVIFPARTDTAALLEIDGGMVHLCYTDGHRLARYSAPQDGSDLRLVLPEAMLSALVKVAVLEGQNGACSVYVDADTLAVTVTGPNAPHVRLGHRLTDGKFPNYRAILPTRAEGSASVPADLIAAAVRRCAAFAGDALKLTVAPRLVTLRGSDASAGESEDALPASSSFEFAPVTVVLNAAYLLDVLRRLDGDVTLSVVRVGADMGLWIVHAPAELERFEYVLLGIRTR